MLTSTSLVREVYMALDDNCQWKPATHFEWSVVPGTARRPRARSV